MTTQNYHNTIQPLVFDLDENVVSMVELKRETIIDFINPVTGSMERVVFNHPNGNGQVEEVLYVPGYHKVGAIYTKDEYEMQDLEELYEWILIED
jgi:hypothetical protein